MGFDLFSYIMGRKSAQGGGGSGGGGSANADGWHIASYEYDANVERDENMGYKISSEMPTIEELLGGRFLWFNYEAGSQSTNLGSYSKITEQRLAIEPEAGSAFYMVFPYPYGPDNMPNDTEPATLTVINYKALLEMDGIDPEDPEHAEAAEIMSGIWYKPGDWFDREGIEACLFWKP